VHARHAPGPTKRIERDLAEGERARSNGRFAVAISLFADAAQAAHEIGDLELEAKALGSEGACQIRLFRYREALDSSEAARQIAARAKDNSLAGIEAANVSTIYAQLGDFSQAEDEARASVRLLRQSPRKDALAKALLNYGSIQVSQGDLNGGIVSYHEVIATSQQAKLLGDEALAWADLGRSYLDVDDLRHAETALRRASDLHVAAHDKDSLALTTANRAELEYRKKNFVPALQLLDTAFASRSSLFSTSPQYEPVRLRGEILLALDRRSEALAEFQRAVELADQWRQGALPGDATSIRTSSHLHHVYQDYIALAAQLSIERRDSNLCRQAWEVLAENRAATLREQRSLALQQEGRLPPRYFELLLKLQQAQAQATLQQSSADDANINEIRLQLSSLENEIGIEKSIFAQHKENIPHKKSLRAIQLRLALSEALFSFCLGRDKSFLWAITSDHVNLYQLATEAEIGKQAGAFSGAVRSAQDATKPAQSLSRELFGKIGTDVWLKPNWLIAGDGVLLSEVPFAALPRIPSPGPATSLIAEHTLRFLPSELLLLSTDTSTPRQLFVGIADPIYNVADSRRKRDVRLLKAEHEESPLMLPRLAGSPAEIRSAAKLSGMPDAQLLEGENASGAGLKIALGKTPEVLHFAVHVVSPKGRPEEAGLALSLTQQNIPELLTPELVATYRVPGSLVVMSGCSSEQGETLPSAGVIGLSRAWLLAGAAAVVVSAWPTPDDSGRFFSSFYGHFQSTTLKPGSLVKRAALALQQAQLEMQRSGGYRSSPSFWAAYSVISKE
jgi:CHAT domain-containing protein